MVFSSTIFIFLFLPLVLITHFAIPLKYKNYQLLFFSLIFYGWSEPFFLLIMILSITSNYFLGIQLTRYDRDEVARKLVLMLAIITNIGLLVFYKYTNFILYNANYFLPQIGIKPLYIGQIALPVGISFFTFHALSFIIDIYRRKCAAQRKWSTLALYFAFFPQLIAGPIIRYSYIAGQFVNRSTSVNSFGHGCRRFVFGLGKKVLIANNMAIIADRIFALPSDQLSFSVSWLGLVSYTLQIYFDFSGYSDMAIGLARMFGFRFPDNFKYPYISTSIHEFWSRWHISLSSWFRDYLYIPLGGNRNGTIRTYRNLIIVFLLCGIWHGASWNFVIWGLYHGLFLILERAGWSSILNKAFQLFRHIYAIVIIMIGWVFFRSNDLGHSLAYLSSMFKITTATGQTLGILDHLTSSAIFFLIAGIIFSTPLFIMMINKLRRIIAKYRNQHTTIADMLFTSSYVSLVVTVLILSVAALASGTHNPFIYFRF